MERRMSEEFKIFRGDHDPQEAQGTESAPVAKKPAPVAPSVPAAEAAAEAPQAAPQAMAVPVPPAPPAPKLAPPPALDFHLDNSQLFHTTEAVQQRMAQLASIAHSTANLLDEQAEETDRIAKRLKSL
jgi:hypothetical protein